MAEEKKVVDHVTKEALMRQTDAGPCERILKNGSITTNFGKKKVNKPSSHMWKESKTKIMIQSKKNILKDKYLHRYRPFYWSLGNLGVNLTRSEDLIAHLVLNDPN